jgi:hypothetical protein
MMEQQWRQVFELADDVVRGTCCLTAFESAYADTDMSLGDH